MSHESARTESLFAVLIAMRPEERSAILDRECGADAELRGQMEALVRAHEQTAHLLDRPLAAGLDMTQAHISSVERPGFVIAGRYKLLEEIGQGGMGSVWVAEQTAPVQRKVAIKLIKAGMDSRQVLARFEAERQALAVMDHPNIAKVLDGGLTESGRPYFAMELVKGVAITEYCDRAQLNIADRLQLFVQVCSAIQHAHQKGIIHRDLKPSNILVAPYDGRPVPKVIDFGLAKAMYQPLTDRTLHTGHDMILGTPLYISPEQAQLNNLDVDTRTDVYSLGVLLYELLTGTTPFERQRIQQAAWDEVRRIIREEDPPSPSTRLSSMETLPSLAASRHTEPAKLTRQIRGDLDWIALKALEKDRTRRYETANDLGKEIQRYLAGEPVTAHPPSTIYRLKKVVRKHRGPVLAASALLVTLIAGIVGTSWGLVRAEHERRQAVEFRDMTLDALRATTGPDVEKLLGGKTDLGPSERAYLEAIVHRWQKLAKVQGDDQQAIALRAESHTRVADLWQRLGHLEEACREYEVAVPLYETLVAQFEDVVYEHGLAQSLSNWASALYGLGKNQYAIELGARSLAILKKLAAERSNDPKIQASVAECHNMLGNSYMDLGKMSEAESHFRAGLTIHEKLRADYPASLVHLDGLSQSCSNLALSHHALGKSSQSEELFRRALALQEEVVAGADKPKYLESLSKTHNSLAILLSEIGNWQGAEEQYHKARKIQERLAKMYPSVPTYRLGLAGSHNNLAVLYSDSDRPDEAMAHFDTAIEIETKLVADFPTVPQYRRYLAAGHNGLATLLKNQNQVDKAEDHYRESIALHEKLVADFPDEPEHRRDLAFSHNNLGNLLVDLKRLPEAEEPLRESLAIKGRLAADYPNVPQYHLAQSNAHTGLGHLLSDLGKPTDAEAQYKHALEIQQRLVDAFPEVVEYRVHLAGSFCNLGIIVRDRGHTAESLKWFSDGIATVAPVCDKHPQHRTAQRYLRNCYYGRAVAFDLLKRFSESIQDWDEALSRSVQQEKPDCQWQRACVLAHAGRTAEAVSELESLITQGQFSAEQNVAIACIYAAAAGTSPAQQQEYADRAMEFLNEAVSAGFIDADQLAQNPTLDLLREREDFKKLVEKLKSKKAGP